MSHSQNPILRHRRIPSVHRESQLQPTKIQQERRSLMRLRDKPKKATEEAAVGMTAQERASFLETAAKKAAGEEPTHARVG